MRNSIISGVAIGTLVALLATLIVARDTPRGDTQGVAPTMLAGDVAACADPTPEDDRGILRITAVDADLPRDLRAAIEEAASLTHARWGQWLARTDLPAAPVNLIYMADAGAFADSYEGPEVDGWTTTGFYRSRSHEAVILYSPPYRRDALATTLHELTHLQIAWYLGTATPPWLNEGIAEYLEMLDVATTEASGRLEDGWRFRRNRAHLELLAEEGTVDLATLVSLHPQRFARRDAPRRYASAWALVAFLNHSDAGRPVFEELLTQAHATRCRESRQWQAPLTAYPGGVTALEADLRAWVRARARELRGTPPGRPSA